MDQNVTSETEHVIDLEKGEVCISSCNHVLSSVVELTIENEHLMMTDNNSGVDETLGLLEAKTTKENRKKPSVKKPPKPPRPPTSQSLDAADQKLIKEISELAMLKRARIERLKTMKKMKAPKEASVNYNSLYAMVITIIFCLVIIVQGIIYRGSSHMSLNGSPESAVATGGGLISVKFYNVSVSSSEGPASSSPNLIEQVSRSSPQEEGRRVAE